MMKFKCIPLSRLSLAFLLFGGLTACERPPMQTTQVGYRGLGLQQVQNPRLLSDRLNAQQMPDELPAAPDGGPKASEVYKNVKVLGDLNAAQFTRLMVAMTQWVSPEQGCNYCHEGANFESDKLYTKVVSRRMLQMTRHINADWKTHVGATGVTCYTCHRGQPVPAAVWYLDPGQRRAAGLTAGRQGQNQPAAAVGLTSLPYDPFAAFLAGADTVDLPGLLRPAGQSDVLQRTASDATSARIRVVSTAALPGTNSAGVKRAEWTYALMMHMSDGLGVNCTYCHNSRSFASWDQSQPQRATAWYGLRMVADLNAAYLEPLKPVYPAERLGSLGDAPKANCATCHQGVSKPLNGASMLGAHPELAVASSVPVAAGPEAASATPPGGVLGRVLFDSGKSEPVAASQAVITEVAAMLLRAPSARVDLAGFADKTGDAAANLELAKRRAFSVRDGLKKAGVADDRIVLKKPEFVIGTASADSRRVDIIASP